MHIPLNYLNNLLTHLREADPAGAAARDVSDATCQGTRRGQQLVVLRLPDALRYPVHVAARVGGCAHRVQDIGGHLLPVPGVREQALGVALLDEEGDEAPVDEERFAPPLERYGRVEEHTRRLGRVEAHERILENGRYRDGIADVSTRYTALHSLAQPL